MNELLSEFRDVIKILNSQQVPYAICGGLALAVHGIPRATVDIDLLVPESAIAALKDAVRSIGYTTETQLGFHKSGELNITRLTKFFSDSEAFFILDILHAEGQYAVLYDKRVQVETPGEIIWVLPAEALIEMKSMRNSKQDQWDIDQLKSLDDES